MGHSHPAVGCVTVPDGLVDQGTQTLQLQFSSFATGLPSDPTELVEGGGLPGPVADGPEDLKGALETFRAAG